MRGADEPILGILAALPGELGTLPERARGSSRADGLEFLELDLDGARCLAVVSGVGKVAAARAATCLLARGARRALLVVGTCGGLSRHLATGDLVHCTRAAQADLAVRAGRETEADPALRTAWRQVAAGHEGWFLTADRPVVTPWRRIRLTRAFAGTSVADMETAAVAAVAQAAGVPWAALRAVTDRAGFGTAASFRRHFGEQGGRAADTVPALARSLGPSGPD